VLGGGCTAGVASWSIQLQAEALTELHTSISKETWMKIHPGFWDFEESLHYAKVNGCCYYSNWPLLQYSRLQALVETGPYRNDRLVAHHLAFSSHTPDTRNIRQANKVLRG